MASLRPIALHVLTILLASKQAEAAGARLRRSVRHESLHQQEPVGNWDGDPCFEAQATGTQLAQNAAVKTEIVRVYNYILDNCNTGFQNLECVSKAQFADHPGDWLKLCTDRLGPQPTASAATCQFAKQVLDYVTPRAEGYRLLSELLEASRGTCSTDLPLPCVVQVEQCIGQPNIRYCFAQCLRTGSMSHAMVKPCPTTTTITTTTTTTTTTTLSVTTTYWWQAIVEVVEDVAQTDLDGVGQYATTVAATTTTTMGMASFPVAR